MVPYIGVNLCHSGDPARASCGPVADDVALRQIDVGHQPMASSNALTKPALLLSDLYRGFRRAVLVKFWQLSGAVVARYYGNLQLQFGDSAQALDERADAKEHLFYDHLFNSAELPAALTVLDVGCGMGNLIEYIQSREARIDAYLGIDLLEQFVAICRRKY